MIGRTAAKQSAGFTVKNGSTCNGVDRMNSSTCNVDAGYDDTYRVFLRAGEKLSVSVVSNPCFLGSSAERIKIYQSPTACAAPAIDSCTDASVLVKCVQSSAKITAAADAWYVVVVDGDTPGDGIEYSLTVKLDPASCVTSGCECP